MITQALPQPVQFGINYYVLRWRDYLSRHADQSASAVQPPDYYLAYGDKYCRRFRLELRQRFTPRGQAWIDKTCTLLQQMLEQTCTNDPQAFARLEEDADAFRRLAYSQHATAYIRGGIADLPLRDLILIAGLVDLKDLIKLDGLFQVKQVLIYLFKTYSMRIVKLLNPWRTDQISAISKHARAKRQTSFTSTDFIFSQTRQTQSKMIHLE